MFLNQEKNSITDKTNYIDIQFLSIKMQVHDMVIYVYITNRYLELFAQALEAVWEVESLNDLPPRSWARKWG